MEVKYRSMMEQVSLTDEARAATLSKLSGGQGSKRKGRALRAVVIAACLCLVVGAAVIVPGTVDSGGEPNVGELTSLQMGTAVIHAIIEIETITEETKGVDEVYQKVECRLIYSDELTDGTIYFPVQFVPNLTEGQVLLAEVVCVPSNMGTLNLVKYRLGSEKSKIDAVSFEDGRLALEADAELLFSLEQLNWAVRYYLRKPDENIPSIPKEELRSGMTIEEVIAFLEGTEQALKEWQIATDWPWREREDV